MNKIFKRTIISITAVILFVSGSMPPVFAMDEDGMKDFADPMLHQAFDTPVITSVSDGRIMDGVIGEPVSQVHEGSYNYVYWKCRMSGSGASCWIELNYGTPAQLKTSLTVERSTGLWIHYDYQTYTNTQRNSRNVYTVWDDGYQYVALSASGTASINGVQVANMSVDGWW